MQQMHCQVYDSRAHFDCTEKEGRRVNVCATCHKSIGDGTVFGAKYDNKAYCSASCAAFADSKHEAEMKRQEYLRERFEIANKEPDLSEFCILTGKALCLSCTHDKTCRAKEHYTDGYIFHCRLFDRVKE